MDAGGSLDQDTHNPATTMCAIVPPKPERKRRKLRLGNRDPETSEIAKLRQQICACKIRCQEELKEAYRDNLTELFYLQSGLNFIDIQNLKKKSNLHLKRHLQSYELDGIDLEDDDLQIKVEPTSSLETFDNSKSGLVLNDR